MSPEKQQVRQRIEKFFRQTAIQENQKKQKISFEELFDPTDKGRRILYVMPESIGDIYLSTSLFPSIKKLYPDWNLYVAVKEEYFEILEGNLHIHKVIPYTPQMDNIFFLEGIGEHKGHVEIAYLPFVGTQRIITYTHNGHNILGVNL